MNKACLLLLALGLAGCVEPAGTAAVPTDPVLALQQQQLDLQRQALDQQRARDEAAQRAADRAAADADYERIQSLMRSGSPGVPAVRPVSIDGAAAAPRPSAARIPGMQCEGEGDDARCDALGQLCSDGAIRDDCADAPLGY